MTFDEQGTDTVALQTGFAYTLSINVEICEGGKGVSSEPESWENIVV